MLAANAYFQFWSRLPSPFNGPLDQHSYTLLIESLERVGGKNSGLLLVNILRQESACIITRQAHGCLRQIVSPEGKEFCDFRNLVGEQRSARKLNHGPNQILKFYFMLSNDFIRHSSRGLFQDFHFFSGHRERMHDLRKYFNSALLAFNRCFNDRAHLHLQNFWIGDRQPAPAVSKHGIRFMQLFNAANHCFYRYADLLREILLLLPFVRNEFMQGRINQPNSHWQTIHSLKNSDKIAPLEWQ